MFTLLYVSVDFGKSANFGSHICNRILNSFSTLWTVLAGLNIVPITVPYNLYHTQYTGGVCSTLCILSQSQWLLKLSQIWVLALFHIYVCPIIHCSVSSRWIKSCPPSLFTYLFYIEYLWLLCHIMKVKPAKMSVCVYFRCRRCWMQLRWIRKGAFWDCIDKCGSRSFTDSI